MIGIALIGGEAAVNFVKSHLCDLMKTQLVAADPIREELTVRFLSLIESQKIVEIMNSFSPKEELTEDVKRAMESLRRGQSKEVSL